MFYTVIISFFLLLIGVLILGFRIFFIKGGKFPNIHIGGNIALKSKGINCMTTQDRNAQKRTKTVNPSELIQELTQNY